MTFFTKLAHNWDKHKIITLLNYQKINHFTLLSGQNNFAQTDIQSATNFQSGEKTTTTLHF
jgi:hypothetical protein